MTPASSSTAQPGAPRIVVLGSLNMDIVLRVPHAPVAGETLHGRSIQSLPAARAATRPWAARGRAPR